MRAIIHFRIESMFASIEARRRPEIAGKPVVVVKSSGNTSGIAVSVSPEARAFGASEGMTARHAGRLCPEAVFVPADYALYRSVSAAIMDILSDYTPLIEPDGLDRAWLDVTASRKLFGGPRQMASDAVRRIETLGYRSCAGIAANKLVASVASDGSEVRSWRLEVRDAAITPLTSNIQPLTSISQPPPSGPRVLIVAPDREREFLLSLPVGMLPGVGDKTVKRLLELGVKTIGQLAMLPERLLSRQFGVGGDRLHRLAQGEDHSQVKAMWPPEIINIEHMFQGPLIEPSEVEAEFGPIAERLALELRSQNRLAKMIEFRVQGEVTGNREQVTGGETQHPTPNTQHPSFWKLKSPVNRAPDILFALRRLLPVQMTPGMEALGVSVSLSELTTGDGLQLCLMGDSERRRRLDVLMESVHIRFGDSALTYASSLAAGKEFSRWASI